MTAILQQTGSDPISHLGRFSVEAIRSHPLEFVLLVTEKHPDIAFYECDSQLVCLVNRPEYIRHVLQTNKANYVKTGTPDLMMLRPMLGGGLMTSDGEDWLDQRRSLQPCFTHKKIDGYTAAMVDLTLEAIEEWRGAAQNGCEIAIDEHLSRLTLGVISNVLFSTPISDRAANFGRAVEEANRFIAHYDPRDVSGRERFQGAMAHIGAIGKEILSAREQKREDTPDLLSVLLDKGSASGCPLHQQHVIDQIFTFLMAGHETTAKSVTWCLYWLTRSPEALARAYAEVDAVLCGKAPREPEPYLGLKWIWQCLQEAMRLSPPVWSMTRCAAADDTIDGHAVPAGTLVVISPYALHRRADIWEEPETFRPERFGDPSFAARHPFAYIPFGGGGRVCIGKPFAALETCVILGLMLSTFRILRDANLPVEAEALVTLRPKNGLKVRLAERERQ